MQTDRPDVRDAYQQVLRGNPVREHDVIVGAGGAHVIEHGEGPPLVAFHGTASSSPFLFPLLRHLDALRVLAVDRPGQGLSDPAELPRDRYRAAAVDWIDRLLDALALNSTALLGHSMGGLWATWYALAHPERVDRLVLVGGAPTLPWTSCPVPFRIMATPGVGNLAARLAPPSPKSMMQLARFVREGETLPRHPALIDLLVAVGRDPVTAATDRNELRAIISPFALASRRGFRSRMRVRPDELRGLKPPTLVVWGEQEPLGDPEVARAVSELIPEARLELVPAGHGPWLGHGRHIANSITTFVVLRSEAR
jgi:pimeloyl-ACP methyl ester carboxylesterase